MAFSPITKLSVRRTLSSGEEVLVGVLAQSHQGVFFQYDDAYLARYGNLSPFTLQASTALQAAPKRPHRGLHGVFGDSLPDDWGLLLQDRVFRQHGILPMQLTAMDRLAFVGAGGAGALSYAPESDYATESQEDWDLATLGLEAQALFDGQTEEVLSALVAAGSSGGARPKALLYFEKESTSHCRTKPQAGDEAWLVKFTSQSFALGHEEGLCEAVYLQMAEEVGLQPPSWQLLEAPPQSGASSWLAVKRFDWVAEGGAGHAGRRHMLSACGLLDADFRSPSLDYEDLIKASRQLCRSVGVGQLQFRRAIFNLFTCNQDDHSKNWAFLQSDEGEWSPAPFYDVTFSPHPFKEHATAFLGRGKKPPLKAIQALAESAGYANWQQAKEQIQDIAEVVASFSQLAKPFGIKKSTINAIEKTLSTCREDNQVLL